MSRYEGKIKVVCSDKMCFPIDPKTLEAVGCSFYDPWGNQYSDGAIEIISHGEWCNRLNKKWDESRHE
ncbi:MAG: hypothetical protein RBT49_06410 [Bacteroidales bacterium]|jgi:hypothetical protein|nr:hypothetical protein [Bacteroidales bacterium]